MEGTKPEVAFVIGGPGSGKGQLQKMQLLGAGLRNIDINVDKFCVVCPLWVQVLSACLVRKYGNNSDNSMPLSMILFLFDLVVLTRFHSSSLHSEKATIDKELAAKELGFLHLSAGELLRQECQSS